MLTPERRLDRLLLDTPVLRKLGRRVIKKTIMRSDDNLRIAIRPARSERAVAEEIFSHDAYEKYHKIGQGDVIFDVGAHIGCFAVKAAKKTGPSGKVIALEPAQDSFDLLQENVSLNHLEKTCVALKLAASAEEGIAKLRIFKQSASNSFFERGSSYGFQHFEEVKVRRLDDLARELSVERFDFLKVNVEGSELAVLEGSPVLLKEYLPDIVVERHGFGPSLETLTGFLHSFAYELKDTAGQLSYFAHS